MSKTHFNYILAAYIDCHMTNYIERNSSALLTSFEVITNENKNDFISVFIILLKIALCFIEYTFSSLVINRNRNFH